MARSLPAVLTRSRGHSVSMARERMTVVYQRPRAQQASDFSLQHTGVPHRQKAHFSGSVGRLERPFSLNLGSMMLIPLAVCLRLERQEKAQAYGPVIIYHLCERRYQRRAGLKLMIRCMNSCGGAHSIYHNKIQ